MFLGLRLTEGVSAADFEKAFGTKIEAIYGPVLERLERQGLLVFSRREGKLRLTPYGVDVSNYAMAQFLLDSPDGTEGD